MPKTRPLLDPDDSFVFITSWALGYGVGHDSCTDGIVWDCTTGVGAGLGAGLEAGLEAGLGAGLGATTGTIARGCTVRSVFINAAGGGGVGCADTRTGTVVGAGVVT